MEIVGQAIDWFITENVIRIDCDENILKLPTNSYCIQCDERSMSFQ